MVPFPLETIIAADVVDIVVVAAAGFPNINLKKWTDGSGVVVWIRIDLVPLDPKPDPGTRNCPKFTKNKSIFQPFKTAFVPSQVAFLTYYLYTL